MIVNVDRGWGMDEITKLSYTYYDTICDNCGTDLTWWINQNKRNKIYRDDADDLFCTKKCFREHKIESIEDVTKKAIR